jgi:hypothetical protein
LGEVLILWIWKAGKISRLAGLCRPRIHGSEEVATGKGKTGAERGGNGGNPWLPPFCVKAG